MNKIFQSSSCLSQEEMKLYTEGRLSDELRFKVENHLIDCPLCSEAIEGFQKRGGESGDALESIYHAIDSRVKNEKQPSIERRIIPWNRIAASIIFLLAVGAVWVYYQQNNTTNYVAYFERVDQAQTLRSVDETKIAVDMKEGLQLFNNQNYPASLSFFETYLSVHPESTTATYYAALSALEMEENETALDWLQTVRVNDDQLYEEATWLIAGIHLRQNRLEEAKILLKDLTNVTNGFYSERARDLLRKMEEGE